jgi:transposase
MDDGIGLAEKMLGLPGLAVLDVEDVPGEVVIQAESTRTKATCPSCRRRAHAHDRVEVHLRDLHCFGRPTRLVIRKRRWRCRTKGCIKKTWTETLAGVAPRQVLTRRAGAEVTRQVGQLCRSVASVATEYGVGWDTAWAAVELHGHPLVDDPKRVGPVRALGVDEHTYLSARPQHATVYATGLVDLDRRVMIDLFEGKTAAKLRRWTQSRSERWRKGVRVVALDLTETYRSGLSPHLEHAPRVADPFHVTRVANRMLDQVRRRVQNETLGHRRTQGRSPLSHPKALAQSRRAPRRARPGQDAGRTALRRSPRRGPRCVAGQGSGEVDLFDRRRRRGHRAPRQRHRDLRQRRRPRDLHHGPHLVALAHRDLEPPSNRCIERTDRRAELLRQAGQAGRSRVHELRALQAPGSPPRRRSHLASADPAATDHFNASPLKPEEPPKSHSLTRSGRFTRVRTNGCKICSLVDCL